MILLYICLYTPTYCVWLDTSSYDRCMNGSTIVMSQEELLSQVPRYDCLLRIQIINNRTLPVIIPFMHFANSNVSFVGSDSSHLILTVSDDIKIEANSFYSFYNISVAIICPTKFQFNDITIVVPRIVLINSRFQWHKEKKVTLIAKKITSDLYSITCFDTVQYEDAHIVSNEYAVFPISNTVFKASYMSQSIPSMIFSAIGSDAKLIFVSSSIILQLADSPYFLTFQFPSPSIIYFVHHIVHAVLSLYIESNVEGRWFTDVVVRGVKGATINVAHWAEVDSHPSIFIEGHGCIVNFICPKYDGRLVLVAGENHIMFYHQEFELKMIDFKMKSITYFSVQKGNSLYIKLEELAISDTPKFISNVQYTNIITSTFFLNSAQILEPFGQNDISIRVQRYSLIQKSTFFVSEMLFDAEIDIYFIMDLQHHHGIVLTKQLESDFSLTFTYYETIPPSDEFITPILGKPFNAICAPGLTQYQIRPVLLDPPSPPAGFNTETSVMSFNTTIGRLINCLQYIVDDYPTRVEPEICLYKTDSKTCPPTMKAIQHNGLSWNTLCSKRTKKVKLLIASDISNISIDFDGILQPVKVFLFSNSKYHQPSVSVLVSDTTKYIVTSLSLSNVSIEFIGNTIIDIPNLEIGIGCTLIQGFKGKFLLSPKYELRVLISLINEISFGSVNTIHLIHESRTMSICYLEDKWIFSGSNRIIEIRYPEYSKVIIYSPLQVEYQIIKAVQTNHPRWLGFSGPENQHGWNDSIVVFVTNTWTKFNETCFDNINIETLTIKCDCPFVPVGFGNSMYVMLLSLTEKELQQCIFPPQKINTSQLLFDTPKYSTVYVFEELKIIENVLMTFPRRQGQHIVISKFTVMDNVSVRVYSPSIEHNLVLHSGSNCSITDLYSPNAVFHIHLDLLNPPILLLAGLNEQPQHPKSIVVESIITNPILTINKSSLLYGIPIISFLNYLASENWFNSVSFDPQIIRYGSFTVKQQALMNLRTIYISFRVIQVSTLAIYSIYLLSIVSLSCAYYVLFIKRNKSDEKRLLIDDQDLLTIS